MTNLRNPTSTKPTAVKQFQIHTFNSLSEPIDFLNIENSIFVQTLTSNALSSLTVKRTSSMNDQINNYTF